MFMNNYKIILNKNYFKQYLKKNKKIYSYAQLCILYIIIYSFICKNGLVYGRSSAYQCSSGWQQMLYMNGADAHFYVSSLTQQTHALFTHIQGFSVISYGIFLLHVNLIKRRGYEVCHELLIFIVQVVLKPVLY